MHILIVKLGSIGDIVHTLPAVAEIRRNLPDAEISWVVEKRSSEILKGSPVIDNLLEVDTRTLRSGGTIDKLLGEISRQVRHLRQYSFDVAVDFQGLLKSAGIAKLSGAPKRIGFAKDGLRESAARFLYTGTVEAHTGIHVIHKNLELAAGALNFRADPNRLEFPIATTAEHVQEADEIIREIEGPFAILNPAGGWVTKLWPAERFGELADRLWADHGLTPIAVTAPAEAGLAKIVAANSTSGKLRMAEPSLKGFYELAKRASLYVGGDTGPTHLAVAAGVPVVGIFGPTEWWRNGSPRADDICVERTDITCRTDCHRRTCGNWICLDISVETVAAAAAMRLGRSSEAAAI